VCVLFVLFDRLQTSPKLRELLLHDVGTLPLSQLLLLGCRRLASFDYEVFNAQLLQRSSALRFFLLDSVCAVLREGVEGLLIVVRLRLVMGFVVVSFLVAEEWLSLGMGVAVRGSPLFGVDFG
jgi:hypothetical protein